MILDAEMCLFSWKEEGSGLSAVTDFLKGIIFLANLVHSVILCSNSPSHAALALKIHFQSPLANSQVFFNTLRIKVKT